MNFTCDRTLLFEALSIVMKSVPIKTALPVLCCFLIDAQINGEIVISGFDLDLGITTTIEGNVLQSGKIAVNAKLTLDMVRKIADGEITFIKNDNHTINVFGGSSEFILSYSDGEIFPEIPEVEVNKNIIINQKTLHSLIRQTIFAISQSETKSIYTGALFEVKNGFLTVVCTDTFRFAMRREPYESEENFSFVVQGKVLNDIIRIMKNEDGMVSIGSSDKHTIFEFSNTKVVSRIVDGVFLNYENLIPQSFRYSMVVKTSDLQRISDCASVLMSEHVKPPIRICVENERLFFSCKTNDGHSFDDEIRVSVMGDGMEIGLNNKTLSEVLDACECEEISVNMNTSLAAICFFPKDNSDKFKYIVAPMRFNNKE